MPNNVDTCLRILRVMDECFFHASHVIYIGTCTCNQAYIGETARNLEVRVNEHSKYIQTIGTGQTPKKTPRTQIHMGHFDFGSLMDKEKNKRGILHRTLQTSPK